MLKLRSVFCVLCFVLICSSAAAVSGRRRWQTLNGTEPWVIARAGFSGLFPESSRYSYSSALQFGSPNSILWCDVQLTRDGDGICSPSINLQNVSFIEFRYNLSRTYLVNNVPTTGYFSSDFTSRQLQSVNLRQGIYTRAPYFDNSEQTFLNVTEVFNPPQDPLPTGLWLSVPHDQFFRQRNLSMTRYILSVSQSVTITYISSPEVGFLRSVASLRTTTKRVFQILDREAVEPTLNITYDTLLGNLTFIRTFADGILVPKSFIWPLDNSLYLQNYTSLVLDAHRADLEVFASGFANDATMAYDYSYDPVSEYLSFIDNGHFSVDGVVSDFPVTASATIDCYSHIGRSAGALRNITVISNEGASGEFPGCTDIAYRQAVTDGADVLDCPVQMTSDGIAICMGSINLRDRTSVAETIYSNRTTDNLALNITDGIFTYSLTWGEIQNLRPAMYNPYGGNYSLYRNPRARNNGNITRLSDFLDYVRNQSSISGVLISIENAAHLATEQGLDVTNAVLNTLGETGYNQTATKRVLIKSSDSSVLKSLRSRSRSRYELVYVVDEDIRDIPEPVITEIRQFANSVVISKKSVFPTDEAFVMGETEVVSKLQGFNLSVYVQYFRNEFVAQPWDFFDDAYVELNMYVRAKAIDGVITDYPATADRYRRNRCLGYPDTTTPPYAYPVQPGGLLPLLSSGSFPPAEAPNPILTEGDLIEPPLPPVAERPPPGNPPAAPSPTSPSGQPILVASTFLSGIAILLLATFLL